MFYVIAVHKPAYSVRSESGPSFSKPREILMQITQRYKNIKIYKYMYTLSYYVYNDMSFFCQSSLRHAGFLLSSSATIRNKVSFWDSFIMLITNVGSEGVLRKKN